MPTNLFTITTQWWIKKSQIVFQDKLQRLSGLPSRKAVRKREGQVIEMKNCAPYGLFGCWTVSTNRVIPSGDANCYATDFAVDVDQRLVGQNRPSWHPNEEHWSMGGIYRFQRGIL
jgi:hypothetical protein